MPLRWIWVLLMSWLGSQARVFSSVLDFEYLLFAESSTVGQGSRLPRFPTPPTTCVERSTSRPPSSCVSHDTVTTSEARASRCSVCL
ncbi:hypothetical protein B0H19DRAFT_1117375 [Mycena capillaripes]|nr:hypothetical protein B0H19DRAFT_1117375 [Mycena capillaripes]